MQNRHRQWRQCEQRWTADGMDESRPGRMRELVRAQLASQGLRATGKGNQMRGTMRERKEEAKATGEGNVAVGL